MIPTLEREISSFHNQELRRFIWHGTFPTLSILLSDTKEQKPLLLTHETEENDADREYHEEFFSYENNEMINLPVVGPIQTKTIFWDLTKATEAFAKYQKEHNINRTNPYN